MKTQLKLTYALSLLAITTMVACSDEQKNGTPIVPTDKVNGAQGGDSSGGGSGDNSAVSSDTMPSAQDLTPPANLSAEQKTTYTLTMSNIIEHIKALPSDVANSFSGFSDMVNKLTAKALENQRLAQNKDEVKAKFTGMAEVHEFDDRLAQKEAQTLAIKNAVSAMSSGLLGAASVATAGASDLSGYFAKYFGSSNFDQNQKAELALRLEKAKEVSADASKTLENSSPKVEAVDPLEPK